MNTVVRHVDIGLISYDQAGKVELLNSAACRLLKTQPFSYLNKLTDTNPEIFKAINELELGSSALVKNEDGAELVIHSTDLKLRDRHFKLISIKNIERELQVKELEAWQKLAVALRHEIVNSVTPIASIIDTLNEIINHEFTEAEGMQMIDNDSVDDIKEALQTISRRSQGLIRFVNAYKDFTRIPKPEFQQVLVRELFKRTEHLVKANLEKAQIEFSISVTPDNLMLQADPDLLEMVLLNLIKNAGEALKGRENAQVILSANYNQHQQIEIAVTDNGPGIISQAIDKVFIPFYSTKSKTGGTGVGLSISRRIVQLHRGSLSVESTPNEKTTFLMRFQ